MKPEEFTPFAKKHPKVNKWIIVTNNLFAKDAHGEMSHVWLTNFWASSDYKPDRGFVTFDAAERRIVGLTHWKYV
jgi:hypothetical protein